MHYFPFSLSLSLSLFLSLCLMDTYTHPTYMQIEKYIVILKILSKFKRVAQVYGFVKQNKQS
jgi:hypothetical protein